MKKFKIMLVLLALPMALTACGNKDAEKKNIDFSAVPKEPPALTVSGGDETIEAMRGTYGWQYQINENQFTGVDADSMHPLDAKEYIPEITLEKSDDPDKSGLVTLEWEIPPTSIDVTAWEPLWGEYEKAESWGVANAYGEFQLKEGDYVYEIKASWGDKTEYNGTAYYSFYGILE